MKVYQRFLSIAILSLFLPFSALMSVAQDPSYDQNADVATNESPAPPASETPDPPARAARLQYASGSVSVQPQGTGDWITGQLNRPLTNSDNIWADKDSKAEISMGTALVRIDSESSLTLTNIGENAVQLQLHQGALNLHVRRLYDNEIYEVDTPNQAFTVLKPGDYRFDVDSDSNKTVITVWRGEGESSAQGQTVRIREDQQARFGDATISADDIHAAPSPDSFDEWARSRDERLDHTVASRHVSPDVVGYDDLDEYGTWRNAGDYGDVWVPSEVPAGWAPYSNGHWIWEEPWGWTWVDYDPWGYAPFHYGRWIYTDGYWGWAPGPIWARPYYAPALVTWFGGGWGVGFGFGWGGGIGWCPLGFGEPFIPWYGVSRGYFTNINITNTHITNITNIYNNNFVDGRPRPVDPRRPLESHFANMNKPGGFTAVSRNTLVNSLPVARNNIRVSPSQLSRVTPVRGGLDVKPTRTTMLGGNRSVAAPTRSFARPVVSRMSTPVNRANSGFKPNAIDRPGTQMANRGVQRPNAIDRPGNQMGNRGVQRPNAIDRPGTQMGNVQRPTTNMPGRGSAGNNGSFGSRSFPHPPSAGVESRNNIRLGSPMESGRPNAGAMRSESIPRPPASNMSRGGERPAVSTPRGGFNGGSPRGGNAPAAPHVNSNARPGPRSEMSVPRPPASMSPRGYSAAADRGGYSNPRPSPSYQSNNRPSNGGYDRPSYGGGGYSRPAPSPSSDRGASGRSMPSYSGGNYSRPAPSYGGGNYGGGRAPSYSGGNYGGGRAPSYGGGARSYGGGGGGSFHSSGGGGGGGGHAYSGGGGGGGGGGHVSSSGGGGGHSSGSSHGGRH